MVRLEAGVYWTVEEVAMKRRCTLQTVRNYIHRGLLRAARVQLTKRKFVFLIHEKSL